MSSLALKIKGYSTLERAKNILENVALCSLMGAFVITLVQIVGGIAYASDLETVITTGAQNVYNLARTVSTVVAGASITVALLVSFFSHNQRTVEGSRTIAKGIFITWIVIMLIATGMSWAQDNLLSNVSDTLPGVEIEEDPSFGQQ